MKKCVDDLAFFGGPAAFDKPIHNEQLNLPPWQEVQSAFTGIFQRKYFTNHGPLVRKLDQQFAEFIGAKHAICVTNGTLALIILSKAIGISGEVIVPAFTSSSTVQALLWAGLSPVLCDVDYKTHMPTQKSIHRHITERTTGILMTHLWGRSCDPESLEDFATTNGLKLFFDARHGIGCSFNGRPVGTFGIGEVFSFNTKSIITSGEGGCITTNDDCLADILRTMRNFHPSETFAKVPLRLNGKMSEAQAALALLSLKEYPTNVSANLERYNAYRSGLKDLDGVSIVEYDTKAINNYQHAVVIIDPARAGLHRDNFIDLLSAENVFCRRYFHPGAHKIMPHITANKDNNFPETDKLSQSIMQLPNSRKMTEKDVEKICTLLHEIRKLAGPINLKLGKVV